jgi:hypothetical protein
MSTLAHVLQWALSPPPNQRAEVAFELLQSLPSGPAVNRTEEELAEELHRRIQRIENGEETLIDGE